MWLTESTHIGKSMRVDTNMINHYFQDNVWSNNPSRPFLQNLIGNRWVTEKEIDNILNNKFVKALSKLKRINLCAVSIKNGS